MTLKETFDLAVLLLKFRAQEFVSHRKRDLIDEIVVTLIEKIRAVTSFGPQPEDTTNIPF